MQLLNKLFIYTFDVGKRTLSTSITLNRCGLRDAETFLSLSLNINLYFNPQPRTTLLFSHLFANGSLLKLLIHVDYYEVFMLDDKKSGNGINRL